MWGAHLSFQGREPVDGNITATPDLRLPSELTPIPNCLCLVTEAQVCEKLVQVSHESAAPGFKLAAC